jgi:serine/threonine-protein kinase RsbW
MTPDMELSLPARAENIALVRHALGALGETCDIDEQLLSDIRLAITEACSNVVVHAYAGRPPGPLEVSATLLDDELAVVVRDEGPGIGPHPGSPGLGLGLPLIASLAESVQLGRDERERTEVCMTFSLSGAPHHHGLATDEERHRARESAPAGDEDDQIDPATLT